MSYSKKYIVFFCALLLFVTITGVFSQRAVPAEAAGESPAANADFAGGDGKTIQTAFLIATPSQLDNIRNYPYYYAGGSRLGYYFRLAADIDLTGCLPDGAGWKPVGGNGDDDFYGKFDGGGYTVSGLWINRPGDYFTGFFGRVYNAEITDLNIVLDSERGITGGSYTGGLVGDCGDSLIKRCSVTGRITANGGTHWDYSIGGISGHMGSTNVSECSFSGSVAFTPAVAEAETETEFVSVGGIAGKTTTAEIKNCLVRAEIRGGMDDRSAGLSGTYFFLGNTAVNCFAALSGDQRVFPFFGAAMSLYGGPTASAASCYYYDTDAFVRVYEEYPHETDKASKRLTAQDTGKSAYTGFDFDEIWGFDKGGNLVLRAFGQAYDPPAPKDLTWLYITAACTVSVASALFALYIIVLRRKPKPLLQPAPAGGPASVPPAQKALPYDLTQREREIASYILQGKNAGQIASALYISNTTVKTHIRHILEKSGTRTQKEFIIKYK